VVVIDASIPDRPSYATDAWAHTHLSHFDTHGLTRDDIEAGMQAIFNHLDANPMSIPVGGLTVVHGTGMHSVTPYDPLSAEWIAEYLTNHPAALNFETLTNSPIPACLRHTRSTSRMSHLLSLSRASTLRMMISRRMLTLICA
jgi:hypothetical protein